MRPNFGFFSNKTLLFFAFLCSLCLASECSGGSCCHEGKLRYQSYNLSYSDLMVMSVIVVLVVK